MGTQSLHPKRTIRFGFFMLMIIAAAGASAETIAPGSWVYGALRTFELRGLVSLDPTIPYSRVQAESYVKSIVENLDATRVPLGVRERYLLERLRKEFIGTAARPEDRENRPAYILRDDDRYFSMDWAVGGRLEKLVDEKKGEAVGLATPRFLAGFGGAITLDASYRLRLGPERGLNAAGEKPSRRTRSFRGLTAEFERSLLSADGAWWHLQIGRDYLQWGNGRDEGLILSRTAGSLDHFGGRVTIGRFTLSTVQVLLDGRWGRRLAGHRLTVRLPRGAFLGVNETVVYVAQDLDYLYLLPFSAFYANQYNEAANDNILWSFDCKVPVRRGLVLSGELLVDDLQYEEDDPAAPDKIAFSISADALLLIGSRELELSGGYTYVDIYTYTHKETLVTYAVGFGMVPSIDPCIGSALGPDADRWKITASLALSSRAVLSVEGALIRRGEGNDFRRWYAPLGDDPGSPSDPPFPSGRVLKERTISAAQTIDLGRGSSVSAGGGVRFLSGGPGRIDRNDGFGYLELILDL